MSDLERTFLTIYNNDIVNNTLNLQSDYYKMIQSFMINHPEDPRTIYIKQYFCELYQPHFLTKELYQSLTEKTDTPFLQKTKIFSALPFTLRNIYYPNYFYKILNTPSIYFGNLQNFYRGCYEFFGTQNNLQISEELQKLITAFVENEDNKPFMRCCKDTYTSLEDELNKLNDKKLLLANNPCGYTLQELVNQTVGKAGEFATEDYIKRYKKFFNFQFTAKDFGNGFGYDMYFNSIINSILFENLIEVKTTNKSFSEPGLDSFTITPNELKVMEKANKNCNAKYFIARVYLKDRPIIIEGLEYKNGSLVPTLTDNYYYNIEEKGNDIIATKVMKLIKK